MKTFKILSLFFTVLLVLSQVFAQDLQSQNPDTIEITGTDDKGQEFKLRITEIEGDAKPEVTAQIAHAQAETIITTDSKEFVSQLANELPQNSNIRVQPVSLEGANQIVEKNASVFSKTSNYLKKHWRGMIWVTLISSPGTTQWIFYNNQPLHRGVLAAMTVWGLSYFFVEHLPSWFKVLNWWGDKTSEVFKKVLPARENGEMSKLEKFSRTTVELLLPSYVVTASASLAFSSLYVGWNEVAKNFADPALFGGFISGVLLTSAGYLWADETWNRALAYMTEPSAKIKSGIVKTIAITKTVILGWLGPMVYAGMVTHDPKALMWVGGIGLGGAAAMWKGKAIVQGLQNKFLNRSALSCRKIYN